MRSLIIILSFFFASVTIGQNKEAFSKLNNKTFAITLTQTKGKTGQRTWSWDKDEITFAGNKMASALMKKREKYPPAFYTITTDSSSSGQTIHFKFISKNPYDSHATIELDGTINGDNIAGTTKWVSRVGTYDYTFSGALKN